MKNIKQIFGLLLLCLHFLLQDIKSMENFPKKDPLSLNNFPLLDTTSMDMDKEFQITYKGESARIDGICIGADLCSPSPTLGFYRSRPSYAYHSRCLLVQFDPITAWNFLPPSVQIILEPVRQKLGSSIRGSIAIHGELMHAAGDTVALASHLVNILYHAWVGEILKKGVSQLLEKGMARDDPKLFKPHYKVDLPMGIFESNGIEYYTHSKFDLPQDYAKKYRGGNPLSDNTAITFDRLTPRTVYQHGGHSPDNALFVISHDRSLSTFWSVAIYPGNEHAFVSFYILINDNDLRNVICKKIVTNANTLKEILTVLYNTVLPTIPKQADKNALHNAIIVVRDLIGGSYPSRSKEPSLYHQPEDTLLLQSLQNLEKALYQLENALIFG